MLWHPRFTHSGLVFVVLFFSFPWDVCESIIRDEDRMGICDAGDFIVIATLDAVMVGLRCIDSEV